MSTRFRLDPGSIRVVTFDTSRSEGAVDARLAAITRSTVGICCVDTMCITNAECSTEHCTG